MKKVVKIGKIILISNDFIGDNMAGPAIRYLNIAKELAKYHEVILFIPNNTDLNLPFRIMQFSKKSFFEIAENANCIILQGYTLWNYPFIKKLKIPIVVDLYDPFIFEELEVNYYSPNYRNINHKRALSAILDQLKAGDYFICASEKQKDFWLGMLTAVNRITPNEYIIDKTMKSLIGITPFGLESRVPVKTEFVLKGVYPGIKEHDKVIIWGGGVWDWLDPSTAINAVYELTKKRTDVKLFFMGVKHPNPSIKMNKVLNDAIELSNRLELTNKYVFFNEWVRYEDRYNYLSESDIGINLHLNHLETRFSYRTRILDYIWANLQVITTDGDIMSELIIDNNLGGTVKAGEYKQLACLIDEMLENPIDCNNFCNVKEKLTWENAIEDLLNYCAKLSLSNIKKTKRSTYKVFRNKYFYYISKFIAMTINGELNLITRKIFDKLNRKHLS